MTPNSSHEERNRGDDDNAREGNVKEDRRMREHEVPILDEDRPLGIVMS